MTTLTINDQEFSLPTSWNELNIDQLKIIIKNFNKAYNRTDLLSTILVEFLQSQGSRTIGREFQRLNQIKKLPKLRQQAIDVENDLLSQLFHISESTLDFLLEKIALSTQHFQTLKGYEGIVLQGLTSECNDMTYLEYAMCENYLQALRESKDMEALDQLMAVIYRPIDPKTQKRVSYQPDIINLKLVKPIPTPIKYITAFFFEGCRNLLIESHPHVFTSDNMQQAEPQERNYGHAGIMLELAGPKFGNVDQTADTNVWTIMMYLEQESIKAEKLKNEYAN